MSSQILEDLFKISNATLVAHEMGAYSAVLSQNPNDAQRLDHIRFILETPTTVAYKVPFIEPVFSKVEDPEIRIICRSFVVNHVVEKLRACGQSDHHILGELSKCGVM